jgi:diaminopimelate epimerase
MSVDVPFSKMNGLGNKIIVADMRGRKDKISSQAAIALAANEKTSFDQIMEVRDADNVAIDAVLRIINSDGSEAEACGNGTRCVVSWFGKESPSEQYLFKTLAGLLNASVAGEMVSVDMGVPSFGWQDIPLSEEFLDTTGIELQIGPIDQPLLHTPSVANMGNPHCTFWVTDDVNSYDLERFGPLLENHPIFPERANITLARVCARDHLDVRTWERGAGLTLASGSSSCAAMVNGVRKGFIDRKARISVPGGEMQIEWRDDNHVVMTGPTEFEFDGHLDAMTGETKFETEV